jgi:hypothetical protein
MFDMEMDLSNADFCELTAAWAMNLPLHHHWKSHEQAHRNLALCLHNRCWEIAPADQGSVGFLCDTTLMVLKADDLSQVGKPRRESTPRHPGICDR